MSRTGTVRKYGKTKVAPPRRAEELFAQLPKARVSDTPTHAAHAEAECPQMSRLNQGVPGINNDDPPAALESSSSLEPAVTPALDEVLDITERLQDIQLNDSSPLKGGKQSRMPDYVRDLGQASASEPEVVNLRQSPGQSSHGSKEGGEIITKEEEQQDDNDNESTCDSLYVLGWDDVCPSGNGIEKIAEASYAEVYRITNEHGTSIIKVIRLDSPIKAQTKAQQRSGLVDEEPREEADMDGELQIAEWLSDVPGFVVFKEKYLVKGKAPKALIETHQAFHRRMKRKDPGRLQYYPSPSRYLDDTSFMVVELGDAGTALEDFQLTSVSQVWDVFLHTALALARAEDLVEFEVSSSLPLPPSVLQPTNPHSSTATSTKATSASAKHVHQPTPPPSTPPTRSTSASASQAST